MAEVSGRLAPRLPAGRAFAVAFILGLALLSPACRNINTGAAEEHYAAGDYGRAAEEYRSFIRDNPKSPFLPEAYIGLAWSEYQRGELDEAAAATEIFRRRYPGHRLAATAAYLQANVYFTQRRYLEAENELEDLLRLFPDDPIRPEARFLLARAQAGMLRYAPAAEQYRVYIERHGSGPHVPAALWGRAQALEKLARWDEAAEALDDLVRRFPDRPERPRAMLELARLRVAAGRYEGAEAMLRGVVRDYSEPALLLEARRRLAEVLVAQARPDLAAAVYKSVFDTLDESTDTEAPFVAAWLAEHWARQGDTGTARRYYARIAGAFERAPREHATALAWLALDARARGDRDEAIARAGRFLELYRDDRRAEILERLYADVLVEAGRVQDGRDRLVTLLRRRYALAGPAEFYRVADLSMRLRDYAEALREVEEGLRRARAASDTPAIKSGLYHAIILHDLNGDRTRAVEHWWRLKQLDPNYVTVEEAVYWNEQEERFYRENRILPAMRGEGAFRPPERQAVHCAGIAFDVEDRDAHALARSLNTLFIAAITVHKDLDYVPTEKTTLVPELVGRVEYDRLPTAWYPLRSTIGADWLITGRARTERPQGADPVMVLTLRLLRVDYEGIFPFEYSWRIPLEEVTASTPGIVRETVEKLRLYHPVR